MELNKKMHKLTSKLIIFKNLNENSILLNLSNIIKKIETENYDKNEIIKETYTQINKLLTFSTKYGFNKNLWHHYITFLLVTNENPFTLISEKTKQKETTLTNFVKQDFKLYKQIFNYNFKTLEEKLNINCFTLITNYTTVIKENQILNNDVSVKIKELTSSLEKADTDNEFYNLILAFYYKYGFGKYGLNKAFKLSHGHNSEFITPITSLNNVVLDDLIGYNSQKEELIRNTEAFIHGKKANNVLLYGDAGTGKSTSIKAILNQYYAKGLRMIEVYKHEAKYLSKIINEIKNHNYYFILFMDDLSFEESESEYKYLKALIEGGLEPKPKNILIYATSNRRHLIKETWNERSTEEEDMYLSDSVREKLSLADRFGINIGYYKPSRVEYFDIVTKLASKYPEINMSKEELDDLANKWLMTHGGASGRTAQQLINYLLGNKKE